MLFSARHLLVIDTDQKITMPFGEAPRFVRMPIREADDRSGDMSSAALVTLVGRVEVQLGLPLQPERLVRLAGMAHCSNELQKIAVIAWSFATVEVESHGHVLSVSLPLQM
ncbi:hypothetical protein ADZ36_09020 [Streptomyces fradiae]|uniref:Uncharacterized protein n=2 Tax=Streptomyces TaxID=1883 RepID=A0A3R7IBP3_9ACTN|nr:hypothetical protein ADZ36_09020 [Streptomyces fradiae]OFA43062.1 hypothetical protein BEN35_23445 [Streptomyces fradiae]PQM24501.1 hypothetical protein Sfr7A_07080 [Streptomyces xinghaiensis]RKM98169.1 hypothetical protein SFRA_006610 [Streptomyces xinghaiensis]RNC75136.1 hypothetical protein DC095_004830 [Streptomyces xinghaiensis]